MRLVFQINIWLIYLKTFFSLVQIFVPQKTSPFLHISNRPSPEHDQDSNPLSGGLFKNLYIQYITFYFFYLVSTPRAVEDQDHAYSENDHQGEMTLALVH